MSREIAGLYCALCGYDRFNGLEGKLMPYDANKGYYVADSRGYEDTQEEPWDEPEPEEEPTEEDLLEAQLEAAEAVAGQIQALETRIEILTGALEAIKKACMTWPGKGPAMRHIETLANLGLNDPRHEHIRRSK